MSEDEKEDFEEFEQKILLEIIDRKLSEMTKRTFHIGLAIGLILGSILGYIAH